MAAKWASESDRGGGFCVVWAGSLLATGDSMGNVRVWDAVRTQPSTLLPLPFLLLSSLFRLLWLAIIAAFLPALANYQTEMDPAFSSAQEIPLTPVFKSSEPG